MKIELVIAAGAAVCIGLAGCSGGPPPVEPPALGKARSLADEAETAVAEGRHADASAAYLKALGIHRSLDHGPGILRDLLSLAAVRLQTGDRAGARECLRAAGRYESSLRASNPAELRRAGMDALLAEVAWLQARMDADEGKTAAAWDALARGRRAVPHMQDVQEGRYAAMEARLHLAGGAADKAKEAATRALAHARAAGDETGTADALRYLGRAQEALGAAHDALASYDGALEIDHRLARASKLRDDLLGMSRAAAKTGDMARSKACAARAAGVSPGRAEQAVTD